MITKLMLTVLVSIPVGFALGYLAYRFKMQKEGQSAEEKAKQILNQARKEGDEFKIEIKLEQNEVLSKEKLKIENEFRERRTEIERRESRTDQRETNLQRQNDLLNQRVEDVNRRLKEMDHRLE